MYEIEKIGQIVASRRKELGLTQEGLAAKLHISPQAVSKWETNGGYPDLSLIPALAGALGLTPGELFGSENTKAKAAESFGELSLIQVKGDLALYSDKEVLSAEDGIVHFADGSEANFYTNTVINMGRGEIRFIQTEHVYDENAQKVCSEESSFTDIRSSVISIGTNCNVKLLKGEDGETNVKAKGTTDFMKNLRISADGDTLFIESKNNGNNMSAGENTLTVHFGFEQGKLLKMNINGGGVISVEPDFKTGELFINGSGDIEAEKIDSCSLRINGSGDIQLKAVEKDFDAKINGSGDVTCDLAANASIKIFGSGDVSIGKCSGSLSACIAGNGDVKASGEVEKLYVQISGSGDLDAEKLSADEAEIKLSGQSEVTVGRIVGKSVERIGKGCELKVLRRG